jgi:hypothetical protein
MSTPRLDLLPTQLQFCENGLEACASDAPALKDISCSICIQNYTENDESIVKLVPCSNCYFHEECIKAWFASTHQRRGTCPNDRTVLFQPNPLVHITPPGEEIEMTLSLLYEPIAHMQLAEAADHHAAFLHAQTAAETPEEIIDVWHNADAEHILHRLQFDISSLRERRAERSGFSASLRDQLAQRADEIEVDYNRFHDRYISTMQTRIRTRVAALSVRVDHLKASDEVYRNLIAQFHEEDIEYVLATAEERSMVSLHFALIQIKKVDRLIKVAEDRWIAQEERSSVRSTTTSRLYKSRMEA